MSSESSDDSNSKFIQNEWSLLKSLLIEKLKTFEKKMWSLSNCISKNSNFFLIDDNDEDKNEENDDDEENWFYC